MLTPINPTVLMYKAIAQCATFQFLQC